MSQHSAIAIYGVGVALSIFSPNTSIGLGVTIAIVRSRPIWRWIGFQVFHFHECFRDGYVPNLGWDDAITYDKYATTLTSKGGKQ